MIANVERPYAAHLDVDYPEAGLDRVSTAFRFLYIIPIAIVLSLVTDGCGTLQASGAGDGTRDVTTNAAVTGGLFVATLLMLVFRRKYPRWWFDFIQELTRFSGRVAAYAVLLTDRYPSTDEEQAVHIRLDYPDATRLNRLLPLVKWFLAIPHFLCLIVLGIGAMFAVIGAWFAILFTGRYPPALFDYVVGVGRWALRVQAYAVLLLTDEYPPFSLAR